MSTRKILLIVDPQNDFVNGSLPVPHAERAMYDLVRYIEDHGDEYAVKIVTSDWHPSRHCSFVNNGGEWPVHCVQHSSGAAVWQPLLDALNHSRGGFTLLYKGDRVDRDEYSIMENGDSAKVIMRLVNALKVDQIDVCGLAGDVCVLNTVNDLATVFGVTHVHVLTQFAPSLDDGSRLQNFISANQLVS